MSSPIGAGRILKAASAILLLSGVVLSLLGYGGTFAVESVFGVPHDLLYTTPTDLLSLSALAISGIVDYTSTTMFMDKLVELAFECLMLGTVLSVYSYIVLHPQVRGRWSSSKYALKRSVAAGFVRLRPKLPRRWLWWNRNCLFPLYFCLAPIFFIGLVLSIVVGVVLLPTLGSVLATRHLNKWVVSADYCTPIGRSPRAAQAP